MVHNGAPDPSHPQLPLVNLVETPGRGFQADGNHPWNEPPSRQEIAEAWGGLSPEDAEQLRLTGIAGVAGARVVLAETSEKKIVAASDERSGDKSATRPTSSLKRRNSLSRALTPEYLGLEVEDYAAITPQMVELAAPERLRSSLIGVSTAAPKGTTVRYWSHETGVVLVAVTPQEHRLMNRYVNGLGDRAAGRTRESRQAAGAPLSPADRATADRSGAHAVETRAEEREKYLYGTLEPNLKVIQRFKEAAQYPGLARFSDEGDMRMNLAYLRTSIFGDMIATIGEQRRWTPEQAQRAQLAIDKCLFVERSRNQHIKTFRDMLVLAEDWNMYKWAVIKGIIADSHRYLGQHATAHA